MKNKTIGVCALLLSIVGNYCVAQDFAKTIDVKNDTGQDLYVELTKGGVGTTGIYLYEDKDHVGTPGVNRLLKAGSSITISNFPKNPQGKYSHMLWVSKAPPVAGQPLPLLEGLQPISPIWLGSCTGQATVMGSIPVINGIVKLRIFKINDDEYGYEFVSK